MHQFGWLSGRGGNFLNLHQKDEGTQKGGGGSFRKGGIPTLEETMESDVFEKTITFSKMWLSSEDTRIIIFLVPLLHICLQ